MNARIKKKLFILVGVLTVIGLAVVGAYFVRGALIAQRMDSSLRDGMAAYKAGDYQSTLRHLGYYAGKDQGRGDVMLAIADALRNVPLENRRHISRAIPYAKAASELMPKEPAPLEMLMALYEEAGFITERLAVSDRLLTLVPSHREARTSRAVCLARIGKAAEALVIAEQLAAEAPQDVDAHGGVIELMNQMGRPPGEVRTFIDRAVEQAPNDARFRLLQSQVYAMSGDAKVAAAHLTVAASLPISEASTVRDVLRLLDVLSVAEPSLGPIGEQLLAREMAGELASGVATVAAERAWKNGQQDQAREYIARAFDPGNVPAATDIALGWYVFLNPAGATQVWDAALVELKSRSTKDALLWSALNEASSALAIADFATASAKLSLAGDIDPRSDIAQFLRGDTDQRLGEWRRAATCWETLMREQPTWRIARLALVSLLSRTGQYKDAVLQAEVGLSLRHNVAEANALADALVLMVEAGEATPEQLRRSLEVLEGLSGESKSDPSIAALLARLYLATDRKDDAVAQARALMAQDPPQPALLASLAVVFRAHDQGLANELLLAAQGSGGDSEALALATAQRLVDDGDIEQATTTILTAAANADPKDKVGYELALAGMLERARNPGAFAIYTRLAAAHEANPVVQLALLDAPSAWADEPQVNAAIRRLRSISGEESTAWRIYEARRLLTFEPSPARAALAVQLLAGIIRQDQRNVSALSVAAEAHLMLDDRDTAIDFLSKAADAEPNRASLYPRLIDVLLQAGRTEEAGRRLMTLGRFENLPPELRRRRARLFAAQGDWQHAEDDFAFLAQSGDADDQLALAQVRARRGDAAGARLLFDALAGATAPSEKVMVAAADFYASQGEVDRGRDLLQAGDAGTAAPRQALLAAFLERHNRVADAEVVLVEQASGDEPDAVADLARFLIKHGKTAQATAAVDRGLAKHPDHPRLKQISAVLRIAKDGASTEAMSELAASLDSPDIAPALRQLVAIVQDYKKAPDERATYVRKLQELTKANPTFFPGWRQLAEALFQQGDRALAVETLQAAVRSNPNDPRPAQLATAVLAVAGRHDEALFMAREWRSRSSGNTFEPDVSISAALSQLGQFQPALAQLEPWRERIAAEAQSAPATFEFYAKLLAMAGRTDEAHALVWPLAERDVSWEVRYLRVGEDLEPAACRAWIARIEPRLLNTPAGNLALGQVFYKLAVRTGTPADHERAIDVLQAPLNDTALRAAAAQVLGASHQALNQFSQAISSYRIVVQERPNDAVTINNLAYLLADDERTCAEAFTLASRAIEIVSVPGSSTDLRWSFLDTLGVAALKCKRFEEAFQTFSEALKLNPNDLNLLIGFAEAAVGVGRPGDAEAVMRTLDARKEENSRLDPGTQRRLDALKLHFSGSK